jgi:hypothetical protein
MAIPTIAPAESVEFTAKGTCEVLDDAVVIAAEFVLWWCEVRWIELDVVVAAATLDGS